ncbi:Chromosomal replication initiator protein dnaA [Borrelia coriaceae ATCC 43381]|uniref:Chromosomal replication initiator protein dnaA n=1 Tax=Borrelia coriaceae ATCC 43381 TaxID=1408429 RepID=W5STT0_9SPIR|nr:Chromosomal replication initiator protein dnaA [Borrelia coriaceae ATCC 43381]
MQEGKNIWSLILAAIRKELSEEEFYIWFENLYFIDANSEIIKIATPNSFHKNQVEKRFSKRIKEILIEKGHDAINVEFINSQNESKTHNMNLTNTSLKDISIQQDSMDKRMEIQTHTNNIMKSTKQYTIKEEIHTKYRNPFLKKKYTFENFITGPNNKLAYNASLSIAKNPGKKYNPCLIYGGVGLGKTHLLQSIGNKTGELHKEFKILYVTAENFLNEFVESIKTNETKRFKKKYRYLDMLLLDDIHDLQKKKVYKKSFFTLSMLFMKIINKWYLHVIDNLQNL